MRRPGIKDPMCLSGKFYIMKSILFTKGGVGRPLALVFILFQYLFDFANKGLISIFVPSDKIQF